MTSELIERLRAKRPVWAYEADGSPAYDPINPDGPEAADALEALSQRIKELEAGLRAAEMAMTCRRDDDAHYCPNCDNSLYAARADIRALLQQKETSND